MADHFETIEIFHENAFRHLVLLAAKGTKQGVERSRE